MSEKWTKGFLFASIIHAVGFALWSVLFVAEAFGVNLNLSRITAGGGAGMWHTMGYLLYGFAGFLGTGMFGVIYYILPKITDRPFNGILSALHLILYNIGVVGVSVALGLAGFIGGTLTLEGNAAIVHTNIVAFVEPAGLLLGVGAISILIFLINVVYSAVSKPKTPSSTI